MVLIMRTIDKIRLEEMGSRQGELVISHNQVVVLKDVGEDEFDCYWIFEEWGGREIWSSCVGGWTALKGFIPDKDYKQMVDLWEYNRPYWKSLKVQT